MGFEVVTAGQKERIDEMINIVASEKRWENRPKMFADLFGALKIGGDPLVEDHHRSCYQYLPMSIYILLGINDVVVSDAFFKAHGRCISQEFVDVTSLSLNYLRVFYNAIDLHKSYPTTDNMTGAIFLLRDLSFLEDVSRDAQRGRKKAVSWLEYLLNQIDNYMDAGEEKERFRVEIKEALAAAQEALAAERKKLILGSLNTLFIKLEDIQDSDFLNEVVREFDAKIKHLKKKNFQLSKDEPQSQRA